MEAPARAGVVVGQGRACSPCGWSISAALHLLAFPKPGTLTTVLKGKTEMRGETQEPLRDKGDKIGWLSVKWQISSWTSRQMMVQQELPQTTGMKGKERRENMSHAWCEKPMEKLGGTIQPQAAQRNQELEMSSGYAQQKGGNSDPKNAGDD